jgi:hypothetical protein
MMKDNDAQHNNHDALENLAQPSSLRENLTAIHVAAQLMCRQSEGRQTYPVAKSIVMLTEQAINMLKARK